MTAVTTDRPRVDSDSTRLSWPSCWQARLDRVGDLPGDLLGTGARIGSDDQRFLDRELRILQASQLVIRDEPTQEDEKHQHENNPILANR